MLEKAEAALRRIVANDQLRASQAELMSTKGALLDLNRWWADAGKPYPRTLDRWLKRKEVEA